MKKAKATILAVIAGALCMTAPAQADDKNMDMLKGAAMFPVKVAGVGTAMVFGTPIAVTRRTSVRIREYTSTFADKIGGHEHFPPNLFASLWSVPCGTLVGVSEGVYYGGKNAIVHGVEKPFCTDSFSLGDLD